MNVEQNALRSGAFPVEFDPSALAQLERIITKDGRPDVFLRIGVKGGGCTGLEYVTRLETEKKDSDLEVTVGAVRAVCDPKSARFLQGAKMIYTGNLIGGGFKFENPNAARSCGCGTSFSPKAS